MIEGLMFDLRLSIRALGRDRLFAAAAVAMLALALSLNVTVYTVMEAMLFRGFPHVQQNDRLVYLQERYPSNLCCISYPDFEDWRAQSRTLEAIAYVGGLPITMRDGDRRAVDMRATTLSANAFTLLGVPPLMGRDFVPEDEAPGARRVAILNYRFWERRYAKRVDIVGREVLINNAPATIIGVMPQGFDFPMRINGDLWMPVVRTPELLQRGLTNGGFTAVARLRNGASLPQVRAELETINRRLEGDHPSTNRGLRPTVIDYAEFVSGPDAALIWGSLWAGACFVFVIACANLTNLTLVRTVGRWREFSAKMALGAGRHRLIRQMVMESLVLVSVAAMLAWGITYWSVGKWAEATASQYQVLDYRVDVGTLVYLLALAVVAVLLLSAAPAARAMQLAAGGALKSDARGATPGRRGKHLSAGLVAGQMALALILLSGAGVLVRSFTAIVGAETGVRDPATILVGLLRLPSITYPDADARQAFFDRVESRLQSVAGIELRSVSSGIPVKFGGRPRTVEIAGRPRPPEGAESVLVVTAGTDYFRVIGVPTPAGRDFNDGDHGSAELVAIVNESFAAKYWPGQQAIGQRIRAGSQDAPGEWRTVVGIAANVMQGDPLRQAFMPLVYVPFRQVPAPSAAFFLARTAIPAERVAAAVRSELQSIDPDVGVEHFNSLEGNLAFDRDFMDPEHSELGKHAAVAPVFAVTALTLAIVGLVAVVVHSVTQRTREIGIRMAIGAASRDIRRLILREGLWPVAIGVAIGCAASLAVNRLLQSQLVGVLPHDPLTMTLAPAVLSAAALLACQIPARRAMRVDPTVALRHE